MVAALNVTEPCSTGIGGDAFVLYYDAATKKVSCLMGNGASSQNFSLEMLALRGIGVGPGQRPLGLKEALCVTCPGAPALWEDLIKHHGTKSLAEILAPAIDLAENGYPVSVLTALQNAKGYLQGEEANKVLRPDGVSPSAGDIVYNKDLANTFKRIAELGVKEGFYRGPIAEAIVAAVAEFGGVLDLEDLDEHATEITEPVSVVYKGHRIYETPPPTHGIATLIALKIIENIEASAAGPDPSPAAPSETASRGSVEQAHIGIECMRIGYADALQHVADPRCTSVPIEELLSDAYAAHRAANVGASAGAVEHGDLTPFAQSDTVYACCIDAAGNGCSIINSNYMGYGTGIMPKGTGFTLQNRGHNVSLVPGHPNQAAPRKRPYHTIIPGLITKESDQSLFATFGNMGGFMQPMGHLQLVRNLIDFKLNPQEALDAPRWYLDGTGDTQSSADMLVSKVKLEYGYGGEFDGGLEGDRGEALVEGLEGKGHTVAPLVTGDARSLYGRGQIIVRNPTTGVLWGGSDPRADGCAMPCIL